MTFDNKIFLTFDIDWAPDEVILDTLQIVQKAGIKATFFATHESRVMRALAADTAVEVGIHPNFNVLFDTDRKTTPQEILAELTHIYPDAVSYRAHSLTQSSRIRAILPQNIRYDCNIFLPALSAGICLLPYIDNLGNIMVPHLFEDDLFFDSVQPVVMRDFVEHPGLKVFDFHPIHVFLNTADNAQYQGAKPYYQDTDRLRQHVNPDNASGVRSQLLSLIESAKEHGCEFCAIRDIELVGSV